MTGRSSKQESVWCTSVLVPMGVVGAFEEALSPHCDALSWLETDQPGLVRLNGYTPEKPDEKAIGLAVAGTAARVGPVTAQVTVTSMLPRDWASESLKTFPPVSVGRYFIHGSHVRQPAPQGAISLCIEAGAAFGTGSHESTAGCLTLMDRLAKRRRFARILDVGCGSGILSLAAAKTWTRARVLGVDLDFKTVGVAKENARINGEHGGKQGRVSFAVSNGYDHPLVKRNRGGGYNLIVSNILARPLMGLARHMGANLAPGGVGILSGFLVRDERRVLFAHRAQGFRFFDRTERNGWVALAIEKGRR